MHVPATRSQVSNHGGWQHPQAIPLTGGQSPARPSEQPPRYSHIRATQQGKKGSQAAGGFPLALLRPNLPDQSRNLQALALTVGTAFRLRHTDIPPGRACRRPRRYLRGERDGGLHVSRAARGLAPAGGRRCRSGGWFQERSGTRTLSAARSAIPDSQRYWVEESRKRCKRRTRWSPV